MATVKLIVPHGHAVAEVDESRVEKFVAAGWVQQAEPKPRRKKSDESEKTED